MDTEESGGGEGPTLDITSAGYHSRVLVSMIRVHPPAAVKHHGTEERGHALVSVQNVGTSAACHVIGRRFS